MDMTVITQLYCQLYITRKLHVSANTIFGHHQVGYNYRRKLYNIYHIIYCVVFSDSCIQPDDGQKYYWPKHVVDVLCIIDSIVVL